MVSNPVTLLVPLTLPVLKQGGHVSDPAPAALAIQVFWVVLEKASSQLFDFGQVMEPLWISFLSSVG